MTVRELLMRLDSRELAEWMAFYRLEPFGEERADLRSGIVAATVASQWARKGQRPVPVDFMPFAEKPKRTQSTAEMQATWQAFINAVTTQKGSTDGVNR